MNERMTPADVAALKKEILSSLHCALPGNVVYYDAEKQTANICPMIHPKGEALPMLNDVPVFMPVPFEVQPGDACLVIFSDYDADRWLDTGVCGEAPSARQHSLSDGFAFVGWKNREENETA